METRITVNGSEYGSVGEMPPDVRRQYEHAMRMVADRNGNGVPDILEGNNAAASAWPTGSRARPFRRS